MSTVAIIGRMLLALVVVLGIMWGLARWARKPMGVGKAERVMSVLARQQLSRTSSVAVLRVMDRALVLGVTEHGIRLITETELAPIEDALVVEPAAPRSWPRLRPSGSALASADDAATSGVEAGELADSGSGKLNLPAVRAPGAARGKLDGSVLSPDTWRQLMNAARDLTVRR